MHVDQADQSPVDELQLRVCIPQLPQRCVASPAHVCPVQASSHSQLRPQVCVPLELVPQRRVSPTVHEPWPVQADQADHCAVSVLQVRDCIPQLPQACVAAPLQVCPLQLVPQRQAGPQVWVPPAPQMRVSPGGHAPSPLQADHSDHVPFAALQVRVRIPQLPQACVASPAHI